MADECADDDPVVREIDVYVSQTLKDNLYLLQYPVRPAHYSYNQSQHLAARMKPKQQKLELEIGIETESSFYCQGKGSQLASTVDSSSTDKDFFTSGLMDKQILTSDASSEGAGRHAIGFLCGNELHLTPVKGLIQLRPNFRYLDKVDKPTTSASVEAEEEEAQTVTVRFARTPTDRVQPSRIQTSRQQERQWEEEPWIDLSYNEADSEISRLEHEKLLCSNRNNELSVFNVSPGEYLRSLCPAPSDADGSVPDGPSNVLSISQLKGLEFIDQIKALLMNAKVIKFNQICMLLEANSKQIAVLRAVSSMANLVQGCWVVKSELVYPDGSTSPTSGVGAEVLRNGRDYVLWKFTQTRFVVRKEISSVVKLPFDDLKDILEQVARLRVTQGWEFVGEYDEEFVKRHNDIVTRQQQIWDAKYKKLCEDLGISNIEKITKGETRKSHDNIRTKATETVEGPKGSKPRVPRSGMSVSEKGHSISGARGSELSVDGHSQKRCDKGSKVVIKKEPVETAQPMDIAESYAIESVTEVSEPADVFAPMELDCAAQVEVTVDSSPSIYFQRTASQLSSLSDEVASASASDMSGVASSSAPFQSVSRIPAASAALSAASNAALAKFLRSFLGRGVVSFRSIRDAVLLKQEGCNVKDPLNVTIPDIALEKSLHAIGAVEVEYKRKPGHFEAISSSRLFALKSTDETTDKYRHVLLEMFRDGTVWQKKQIVQRIAEKLGEEPTQREVTKVLKDLCYCKSNKHWHLNGTE
ncbi:DNA-directed RNA polymerase III subunit RPC5-like [Corticium candelabrum]|uniref:DNA-directed RNA polymerase III subunit RPC5-like n=1 Tax=Corticium candelabrum TaxID=121492 RepID=UPI002E3718AC|nr:DNA-directed RNA polymerase III subunit RPC5-like [Corticium candelabrum]